MAKVKAGLCVVIAQWLALFAALTSKTMAKIYRSFTKDAYEVSTVVEMGSEHAPVSKHMSYEEWLDRTTVSPQDKLLQALREKLLASAVPVAEEPAAVPHLRYCLLHATTLGKPHGVPIPTVTWG